jgi:hypothetical protein
MTAESTDARQIGPDRITVEAWDRHRDRRAAALLVIFALAVYLLTATYSSYQVNDNRAVNISAWSLATQGTLALPDHFAGGNRWIVEGRDGELYTNRFPGAILWATPFHAVAALITGGDVPDHPVFLNYAPGGVAAAAVTALAVGASFLLFRRLADRRLAVAATVVLAFGTGVWSVSADAIWTHGPTHLLLVLGVLAAADGRNNKAGLAFAVAILTRPPTAVVAAVTGIWSSVRSRRVGPIVVIGAWSATGALALAAYSQRLFGTWQPIAGYREDAITSLATSSWEALGSQVIWTLVHPLRGVLIYTPFLLVLTPLIRHGWRTSPWWVRSSAVGGLVYMALQLRFSWSGGGGYFGSRMTLETLVLAAPLLLRTWQAFVSQSERLKGAAVGLMAVAVVTHGLGATVRSIHPEAREEWRVELETFCEQNPELDGCRP